MDHKKIAIELVEIMYDLMPLKDLKLTSRKNSELIIEIETLSAFKLALFSVDEKIRILNEPNPINFKIKNTMIKDLKLIKIEINNL